jgi:hypothetical protein
MDSEGRKVVETETKKASGVEFTLPGAGTYFVYGRKLGPGGIGGPVSRPLKLQFLGLGARQKEPTRGVFLLERGERVSLVGFEGLEMRYGKSTEFLPASPTIGLSRQRPTRVEFRDPADRKNTVTVRLAPRIMKPRIDFDSPRALWPGKPVGVRVQLRDGTGRIRDLEGELRIVTRVNMTRISPKWTMTEAGLATKISAQEGKGPWVIRINVLDRRGRSIARQHLEVAPR